jgi:hypothetical protein
MYAIPAMDLNPPERDEILATIGEYTICRGGYGVYILDGAFDLARDVDVFQCGQRNDGLQLKCGCRLRMGDLYFVDGAGETRCEPCFAEAITLEDEDQ